MGLTVRSVAGFRQLTAAEGGNTATGLAADSALAAGSLQLLDKVAAEPVLKGSTYGAFVIARLAGGTSPLSNVACFTRQFLLVLAREGGL